MADQNLKIISNPYIEQIEFQIAKGDGWEPISSTNPNSALLSESIQDGFLPFKASTIMTTLLKEYGTAGDTLNVCFEGPSDEYEELALVCDGADVSNKVKLIKGERNLPNARDVLPEIIGVFQEVVEPIAKGLAGNNEVIERDIKKFTDASSDAVPLCVVGNYSAGKSTFINALIGQELLPTGDQPVTAKVFKIMRSKQRDRGHIAFSLGEDSVLLQFDTDGIKHDRCGVSESLQRTVLDACDKAEPGLIPNMAATLDVINHYKPDAGSLTIADLIEIVVPFCPSGTWGLARDFVIFDTPGSNSASNVDHLRVLRDAMEGMSNGMPIFVAEHRSLDSTDNQKLFEEIERIEAMDDRFAMIVVNRADEADLPKGEFSGDDIREIMDKAMPRHLFAQGIYFVSSVMGLGSKCDGQLRSYMCAKIYARAESSFADPEDRFYTELYRYNVVPGQIRPRMLAASQACQNKVLANSGLCCVEQELELFAERYSAYDKCGKSVSLLRSVAVATSRELESTKKCREEDLELYKQLLEKEKAALIEDLKSEASACTQDAISFYPEHMSEFKVADEWKIESKELRDEQSRLSAENLVQYDFEKHQEEAEAAQDATKGSFAQGLKSVLVKPSLQSAKEAVRGLEASRDEANAKLEEARQARKDASNETAEELLAVVRDRFSSSVSDIGSTLDAASRSYWAGRSEREREAIRRIATGSDAISDSKRQELEELIASYPALSFEGFSEDLFNRSKFERGLRIGKEFLVKFDGLNLEKIKRVYNANIVEAIKEIASSLEKEHKGSFKKWIAELLGQTEGNITKDNPELHKRWVRVRELEVAIEDLEMKLSQLEQGALTVSEMIDWAE